MPAYTTLNRDLIHLLVKPSKKEDIDTFTVHNILCEPLHMRQVFEKVKKMDRQANAFGRAFCVAS